MDSNRFGVTAYRSQGRSVTRGPIKAPSVTPPVTERVTFYVEAECVDCGSVIVLADPSEAERWGDDHECS